MDTLKAETRERKPKAKELRRKGWVTGSVYGRDLEGAISIRMNTLELEALLRKNKEGSKVVIELDGEKKLNVIIKEIQYNFLTHQFLEVDFQTIPDEN